MKTVELYKNMTGNRQIIRTIHNGKKQKKSPKK
jgi:hypothetical protein